VRRRAREERPPEEKRDREERDASHVAATAS
jgi:hypothetical protein